MTLITTDQDKFDVLIQLVDDYEMVTTRLAARTIGGNQKEQAHNKGVLDGFRQGVQLAMVTLMNKARCELYSTAPAVEMRYPESMEKFLHQALVAKNQVFSPVMAKDSETAKQQKEDNEEKWSEVLHSMFNDWVRSPEMEEERLNLHREAVLAGNEEPTAEDADWINELDIEAANRSERLRRLAQKVATS